MDPTSQLCMGATQQDGSSGPHRSPARSPNMNISYAHIEGAAYLSSFYVRYKVG